MADATYRADSAPVTPSNVIDISTPVARLRLKLRRAESRGDMEAFIGFFQAEAGAMSAEEIRAMRDEALDRFCRIALGKARVPGFVKAAFTRMAVSLPTSFPHFLPPNSGIRVWGEANLPPHLPTFWSGCRRNAAGAGGPAREEQLCASGISTDVRVPLREGRWWTGLDSNQRTLARADLQSAAFNHSATCPHMRSREDPPVPFQGQPCREAGPWRSRACVSMGRVAGARARRVEHGQTR